MIRITDTVRSVIETDGRKSFPDECCGFLFGEETAGGDRLILEALVVDNANEDNRRRRFEISPRDYLRAEQYALSRNLQLLGVYHSHPDHPAIASEHDRKAAQPWFSYLILSVMAGKPDHWRSWRLNDQEQFEEEPIAHPIINQEHTSHGNSYHSDSVKKVHQ